MKYLRKNIINTFSIPLVYIFISLLVYCELPVFHNLEKDFNFLNVERYIRLEGLHNHESNPSLECIDSHKVTGKKIGDCHTCFIISNLNSLFAAQYENNHYYYQFSYVKIAPKDFDHLFFRRFYSPRAPPLC